MLSGSSERWRGKDTWTWTPRYHFKSGGPQLCGLRPIPPGSILSWAHTAHLQPLALGLPCWCQSMGCPASQANTAWRCGGGQSSAVGAYLWPRRGRSWWINSCLCPPGTGYPETKLHSFLEDSLQGLNKQLPLVPRPIWSLSLLPCPITCVPVSHSAVCGNSG